MEEKKETQSSRLLQEQAEYHCRLAQRKVRNVFVAQIKMRVNLDSTGWNIFSKSGFGCGCQHWLTPTQGFTSLCFTGEDVRAGGSGEAARLPGRSGLREVDQRQNADSAAVAQGRWARRCPWGCRVHRKWEPYLHNMFLGTRQAVQSGEQVPGFHRRAELFTAQQQHPGGEQDTSTYNPRKCSSSQLL